MPDSIFTVASSLFRKHRHGVSCDCPQRPAALTGWQFLRQLSRSIHPLVHIMNDSAIPFLSILEKNELDVLFGNGQRKLYAKNSLIIKEGDRTNCAYLINSGRVKIYLSDEHGKEIVLSVLKAGEYFGEMSLIDRERRSAGVMAMEDADLTEISQNVFRACLQSHPDISEQIMLGLVTRLREANKKISGLALMSAHERVENMLRGLARNQNGLLVVEEKPTHQHIANIVGASREMVTRILNKMAAEGRIKIAGKKIIILAEH